MKRDFLLSIIAAIITFASCKKDNNTNTSAGGIQGTYKFKYISAKTTTTITGDLEKTVSTADYTTINNEGIIVFDKINLTATGLTYSVNTEAKTFVYENNALIDSTTIPFTFTLPSSTSAGAYQLIGTDSIYFPQGSLTSGIGGNGSLQSDPSGGKYSFAGNLLSITQIGSRDSTFENTGVTFQSNESVVSTIVMEKQ